MSTATEQPPQFTTASFRDIPPDSHALFVRGVLFGAGGAFVGLILYSTVGIMTGLVIGYMSLAVGYIVGKAILMGSRGRGGRRYQIAALVLTYSSVSVAAVPMALWQLGHDKTKAAAPSAEIGATTGAPVATPAVSTNPATPAADNSGPPISLLGVLAGLLMLGLSSPFLDLQDPAHGLIGLVILAVGMRIAWRLTSSAGPTASMTPITASPLATPDEKPTSLNIR